MSNTAVALPVHANGDPTLTIGPQNLNEETRILRNQRSAGKGRRRRAAAEQRRIDQQRWGQYMQDSEEEEIVVASRIRNRRRTRRSTQYNVRDDLLDGFSTYGSYDENLSLDVALALSLSLTENGGNIRPQSSTRHEVLNMSYENLVLLENVKCVASSVTVSSLAGFVFEESAQVCSSRQTKESICSCSLCQIEELCAVCQIEYKNGDHLMILPCTHNFHHACGSEWLLNYSKLCPVCKHDITEQ